MALATWFGFSGELKARNTDVNPKNEDNRGASAADEKPAAKKTYAKPEVRRERVFETMALTCGKVHPTQGGCHFNRKTS